MALLYPTESYAVRGSAFEVYKQLGCVHKEVVYQRAMLEALLGRKLMVEREKRLPVRFNNKVVGAYMPDFVINDIIVLEIKAKEFLLTKDLQQFWQYLRSTDYKLGFLINFGKPGGVEIIRRIY